MFCFKKSKQPSPQTTYNSHYHRNFEHAMHFGDFIMAQSYIDFISLEDLAPNERKKWQKIKTKAQEHLNLETSPLILYRI
jgi:hypothetical protein